MKIKKYKIPINIKAIIIMSIITAILFCANKIVKNKVTYASYNVEKEDKVAYEYIDVKDDINQIIENNTKNLEEIINLEQIDLEYTTIYENNDSLPKGTIQVIQEGRDGTQEIILKKTYENGEIIKEEQLGRKVTKASIDKIIQIGTANYSSNYKVKIGDDLYVTSNTLEMKKQPNINSENVTVLNKNDTVKITAKNDEWYEINYKTYTGWAKSNCLTYINPKVEYTEDATYSKSQLLAKLNKKMNLNKPSGLSLSQFKKVLSNNEKDKNKIFQNNAEYFYYIEKQYNINGIFVASVGIHESNWGTSKISLDKKNLFGYGAYDSSPYESSYSFSNYSEGIDLLGRVFTKYYLNPPGTKIYDGETATGRYYNGPTLEGVNKKYATDKNWASSVYKWMEYLYNKL